MKQCYTNADITTPKEKEDFVFAFLDYMVEQKEGGQSTHYAKDIVVGFFNKEDGFIPNMSLEDYHHLIMKKQIHSMRTAFMGVQSTEAMPLPPPGNDGPCLLSDFFCELFDLSQMGSSLFPVYCKTFMSLLCNIIEPAPNDMVAAKRLVESLRDKLVSAMMGKTRIPDSDGLEYIETVGKQVLHYLAYGGIEPEKDISVMIRDVDNEKTITDCTELANLLLTMGSQRGLQVMGGLSGYNDLRKHDYISLSDFVTVICTFPKPSGELQHITTWKIFTNFVTMMVYGLDGAEEEQKNIDIFTRLMAVKETLEKKSVN